MKNLTLIIFACILLFSCTENKTFTTENIIPTPKELTVNDNKLHPLKDVVVSKSSDNLIYPQNKDEYYLKSENGNVIIEGEIDPGEREGDRNLHSCNQLRFAVCAWYSCCCA